MVTVGFNFDKVRNRENQTTLLFLQVYDTKLIEASLGKRWLQSVSEVALALLNF